jgi:CubicO group peptidase (beta-lactamase class C family)
MADATSELPHDGPPDPEAAGLDPMRLMRAIELFSAQLARGDFPGGQLAVRRGGRLAADVAVGLARGMEPGEAPQPATPRTRFNVHSASKPLVALAVAALEEDGRIEVTSPVARYLPEFAGHGRDDITVLDVLTHRAGVPLPELTAHPERWRDPAAVRAAIAAARPRFRRGTLAYLPVEFGWILAEIVTRLTGQPLPAFLHERLLAPAGLHAMAFTASAAELAQTARCCWVGRQTVRLHGVDLRAQFEEVWNDPAVLAAPVPGASLLTDAAHLAALYELLVRGGISASGRRLLKAETIAAYTRKACFGFDRANRVPLAVARGFLTGTLWPSIYGLWGSQSCYGHAGGFSTLAFADRQTGLCVAVVTNGNAGPGDLFRRFRPLAETLRRAARP